MDGGAWWATAHGVAQSRARLKRFSTRDGGALIVRESLAVGGRCGRGFDYKGRKSFSRPPGEVWELRVPVSPLRLPGPQPGV